MDNEQSKPKNIDELINYLDGSKNIKFSNTTTQKRQLMNMGYYHGYKGYRYMRNPQKVIPYSKFEELVAVYEFDAQLKALFYPWVMKIETAFKNYVLEAIIDRAHSENFMDIYNVLLDNYKSFSTQGKKYSSKEKRKEAEAAFDRELKRRLTLRDRIYKTQTKAFGNNNKIAKHYLKDNNMPIWAIFELLSLGDFGDLVACLNEECRKDISKKLSIVPGDDNAGLLPQRLIFSIKDLRNSIAHNDVIFDTRFKKSNIASQLGNAITNATGIYNLTFQTITDYLILIIYILKLLKISECDLNEIINKFDSVVKLLRENIPTSIYNQIIYTNNKKKIEILKKYVLK